jgi:hypothetical protein
MMDQPLPSSITELLSWHPLQRAVWALAVGSRRASLIRALLVRAVGAGRDDDDLGAAAAGAEDGASAESTGAKGTSAEGGGTEGGLAGEEGAKEADARAGLGSLLSGEGRGDGGDAEEGDGENAGEHFDCLGVEYRVLKECGRLLEVNECKS